MVDDSLTKIPQQYFAIRAGIGNLQIAFIGVGSVAIPPPPAQKTFDAEGETLEHRGHTAHPLLWRIIDEWNLKNCGYGKADCHPFTIGVYG
jgi:hypothetical protein